MLCQNDSINSGLVSIYEFEGVCDKAGITLTQNEILRMYKLYGDHEESGMSDEPYLNYKKIST